MAVTLNIDLIDAEQVRVDGWLDILLVSPKTPAERKALLENHARRLLRDDLIYRLSIQRQADARVDYDAVIAANVLVVNDEENGIPTDPDDPFIPVIVPSTASAVATRGTGA